MLEPCMYGLEQNEVMMIKSGFTLIELMIVLAILAIISAIAIASYQDYTAKAKFSAALAEITAGKHAVDVYLNEDGAAGLSAASSLDISGLKANTQNCQISVSINTATDSQIVCVISGGPTTLAGRSITLNRSFASSGEWSCTAASDIQAKYRARGCD